MGRNQYKSKAEALEGQMSYLETENKALKERAADMSAELYKLRVVNASFQERLRLIKIASEGD